MTPGESNHRDDARREPPVHPPASQEDVIADVLSDIGRRFGIVRRAAGRALRQEGPATDALRAAQDRLRGIVDAVQGRVAGDRDGAPGRDRPSKED